MPPLRCQGVRTMIFSRAAGTGQSPTAPTAATRPPRSPPAPARQSRYTTSCLNIWEPEEDGQANFEPVGSPYVVLDNGTVAVLHDGENSWQIYDSVPPWEK